DGWGALRTLSPHPFAEFILGPPRRARTRGRTTSPVGGGEESISIAAASVARLRGGDRRERGVVARHIGKAAEVDAVGELRLAGRKLLVAAGGDGEGIAGRDGLAHRLPQ